MLIYKAFRRVQPFPNLAFFNQDRIKKHCFLWRSIWVTFFIYVCDLMSKLMILGSPTGPSWSHNGAPNRPSDTKMSPVQVFCARPGHPGALQKRNCDATSISDIFGTYFYSHFWSYVNDFGGLFGVMSTPIEIKYSYIFGTVLKQIFRWGLPVLASSSRFHCFQPLRLKNDCKLHRNLGKIADQRNLSVPLDIFSIQLASKKSLLD